MIEQLGPAAFDGVSAPKQAVGGQYVAPIVITPAVLRLVGPIPAIVYAIVSASDSGDGVELAYCQIADAAYISISTARRAVAKLRRERLLVSEPTVEELYGQRGNRYRIPGQCPIHVHCEQPCMNTDPSDLEEHQLSKASDYQRLNYLDYLADLQGDRLAQPQGGVATSLPISWRLVRAWTPPHSPMPAPANGNFFQRCREAVWLVAYIERYVLDRENQERQHKGWKRLDDLPDKRRLQFLRDAEKLLREQSLSSIAEVIDWLFLNHGGWLPFDVIDSVGMKRKNSERKVTSLRKIWENIDMIVSVARIEYSI